MGYESRKLETEHAGAKNGGGYRGLRVDAKLFSRKARRRNDRRAVLEQREGGR